jgi:hypothetical protein
VALGYGVELKHGADTSSSPLLKRREFRSPDAAELGFRLLALSLADSDSHWTARVAHAALERRRAV